MADLARKRLLGAGASIALSGSKRGQSQRKFIPVDPALLRQVAMAGNNLNQIARKLNTEKSSIDAIQLLAQLASIQRDLKILASEK
jgi:hypothetical protein